MRDSASAASQRDHSARAEVTSSVVSAPAPFCPRPAVMTPNAGRLRYAEPEVVPVRYAANLHPKDKKTSPRSRPSVDGFLVGNAWAGVVTDRAAPAPAAAAAAISAWRFALSPTPGK